MAENTREVTGTVITHTAKIHRARKFQVTQLVTQTKEAYLGACLQVWTNGELIIAQCPDTVICTQLKRNRKPSIEELFETTRRAEKAFPPNSSVRMTAESHRKGNGDTVTNYYVHEKTDFLPHNTKLLSGRTPAPVSKTPPVEVILTDALNSLPAQPAQRQA